MSGGLNEFLNREVVLSQPESVEIRPILSLTPVWPEGMQRLNPEQVTDRLRFEYSALVEYCWDELPNVSWAGFMVVDHERTRQKLLLFRVEYDDMRHSQEAIPYGEEDPYDLVSQVVDNWGLPRDLKMPAGQRRRRRVRA